ncbi:MULTISPECIES: hypothetical protein [Paenibacillus]|nr:hypothetical protein [Paenibacillus odorifer]
MTNPNDDARNQSEPPAPPEPAPLRSITEGFERVEDANKGDE